MIHEEPSHRPGQDPYAYAPETEGHYGERIKHYQDLLEKFRGAWGQPEATLCHLQTELQRYQGYLAHLIARKRREGKPIRYEYAKLDDTVFVEGDDPFSDGGTPYTKRQMLNVCLGDDTAARRLTTACLERGAKQFQKVADNYESFAYNGSLAEIREIYGSDTIYNRVVLVHDAFKLMEIVFDNGLDHVVGDADPVSDFDEWDRRLHQLRDMFRDAARDMLGEEARLVIFSPGRAWVRQPMPLFEANGDVDRNLVIESHAIRIRTELPIDINGADLQRKLLGFLDDIYEASAWPSTRAAARRRQIRGGSILSPERLENNGEKHGTTI